MNDTLFMLGSAGEWTFIYLCCVFHPLQVMEMVNNLYLAFDGVIESYNVYKVSFTIFRVARVCVWGWGWGWEGGGGGAVRVCIGKFVCFCLRPRSLWVKDEIYVSVCLFI